MIKLYSRGHEIYFKDNKWFYVDNNDEVREDRCCKKCGRYFTKEGHDGCLGKLIGVMSACCGHGNEEECYVQFLDGECVRGEDAKIIIDVLKKYRKL